MNIKVLFIEDREEDYILANQSLTKQQLDFEDCWVKDELSFRQQLADFKPDIVVSDYNLSTFSGLEALNILKELDKDIPFVILSTAIGEERVIEILKMGATDFLLKDNILRLSQVITRAIKEAADQACIKESQEALKENEQQLKMAIEGGGVGLWDWKIGDEAFFNREFAKMVGYDISYLQKNAKLWSLFVHPDDLEAIRSGIIQHFKRKFSFFRVEFRFLMKSGEYKWIMAHGRVIERNDQGKAMRMIGVFVDVHERKTYEKEIRNSYNELDHKVKVRTQELEAEVEKRIQTEKKLQGAIEQAESANQAKSEFLANMSHEIRSPLNAIVGFSQILMSQVSDQKYPKEFMEQLEYIKTSGETLSEVINDILDISKIEEGKMTLSYENVELIRLIRGIYHINKGAADLKNLKFNYSLSKDLPKVLKMDRTKLKQILMNLISNAIKYTPTDGKVVIRVNFDAKKEFIHFNIEDEGIGIPNDQLKSIFTRFKQVDSSISRNYSGTGLGLAITKRLVNLLKGEIAVESKLNEGSVFKVTLPYLPADANKVDKNEINLKNHFFSNDNLVLIIEDNPLNIKMIQSAFKELNIKTVSCNNGLKGLRLATELKPDLILMDMHMPKMDGIETTKAILQKQACKNIPIVALSADAFEKTRKAAIKAGISEYITKPLDFNILLPILKRFLKLDEQIQHAEKPKEKIPEQLQKKVIEELTELQQLPIYETEKLIEKINLIEKVLYEFDHSYYENLKQLKEDVYVGNVEMSDQLIKRLENGQDPRNR